MDGVIPLWKPKGMTSHDCVIKLRKLLKTKKIGHTGTLDPEVEGVLVICIGKATKIASLLTEKKKEYVAEISLGKQTTTEDHTGECIKSRKVSNTIGINDCQSILKTFLGEIEQVPPMYSAVKINGKKLYEYAREGMTVDRPKRKVTIYAIELLSNELNRIDELDVRFKFKVNCSSGTYIRTLCVDIGDKLGYPAHMSHLVRTKAASFSEEETFTFEQIERLVNENHLEKVLISINDALRTVPTITVNDVEKMKYENGQVLNIPVQFDDESLMKICTRDNRLIAIYKKHPTKAGKMKPLTVFN